MNIADKYFRLYLRDRLNPFDLNTAEGTVLLDMYSRSDETAGSPEGSENEGRTQEELIAKLHYDKGVMTRTMKALEEKGYVQRKKNPDDSRSFIFILTEKGRNFKAVIINIMRDWSKILLEGVDEAELDAMGRALDKMSVNAVRYFCAAEQKNKNA